MRPTVMKFGGTSVADAGAFRNVAAIVKAVENGRPIVVTSAIAGFTNALLASVENAVAGDARAARTLDEWFARHGAIATELLDDQSRATFETAIADARKEIRQLFKIIASYPVTSPPLQDQIVAYGELLSSQLLASVLQAHGLRAQFVDARECIKTDENYGNAAPLAETSVAIQELLARMADGEVPVLGG